MFALRPRIYAAWRNLVGAIAANLSPRTYELATIAAARQLRSSYCMLAHGRVLVDGFYDARTLQGIVEDHRNAGLDDPDVAVMDFAEKIAADATSITQEDVDRLRQAGLSDLEIFDVTLAAAVRCFFSKTLDALGALPDARFAELESELREVLVLGRPIASS